MNSIACLYKLPSAEYENRSNVIILLINALKMKQKENKIEISFKIYII